MANQAYVEYSKKRNPSSTWHYFLTSSDRQSAKCKICSRIIKTGGSSTSGLHGHLRSRHKIKLENKIKPKIVMPTKRIVIKKDSHIDPNLLIVKQEPISADISYESEMQNDSDDNKPLVTKTRQDDDHATSMKLVISRMAALDGIPLSTFCTSIDLRFLFATSGYDLPTSVSEVTDIVTTQSNVIKAELKEKLKVFKLSGHKFCLSFEEYQMLHNQLCVSINIHNDDPDFGAPKNLGIFKAKMSIEFDELSKTVSDYLHEYDIRLDEDITAFTCDSSVLASEAGISLVSHRQLCLAQAIQHAVIEVLYRKELMSAANSTSMNSDDSDEEMTNINDMTNYFSISKPRIELEPQLIYNDIIDKVRKLVRYFKNSDSRNSLLQVLVRKKYDKDINLILDCKSRWSSLCEMIGRFLKLKVFVQKCMQYLEMDLFINDQESQLLTEIHDSLVVIKATVTALCKPNANLLTADAALRFMLRKLDEQDNDISRHFAMALRKHIKERRTLMSSILQYLHDRYSYNNQEDDDIFRKPTSDEIVNIIVSLIKRLKPHHQTNQEEPKPKNKQMSIEQAFDDPLRSEDDEELSIEQQLENAINNSCHDKIPQPKLEPQQLDLKRIVMGEISIYDSVGGSRGMYLTMAYEYLLSIVPATAEAEQFFYSSKQVYKGLSCHPGKILNALFFLRSFFLDEKLNS